MAKNNKNQSHNEVKFKDVSKDGRRQQAEFETKNVVIKVKLIADRAVGEFKNIWILSEVSNVKNNSTQLYLKKVKTFGEAKKAVQGFYPTFKFTLAAGSTASQGKVLKPKLQKQVDKYSLMNLSDAEIERLVPEIKDQRNWVLPEEAKDEGKDSKPKETKKSKPKETKKVKEVKKEKPTFDYKKMTKKDLASELKKLNVAFDPKLKKEDLIKVLKKAIK